MVGRIAPQRVAGKGGRIAPAALREPQAGELAQRSSRLRQAVWRFASVFNDRIRFGIVDFVWSLSELVVSGALIRRRFLMTTVILYDR